MPPIRRDAIIFIIVLLIAAGMFFTGIHWGLPSKSADPFLFGERTPWTGKEILALAPSSNDVNRGADVDASPLITRDRSIILNDTDARRAEIVRRYRLFSAQPDEMITFMALAQMRPGLLQLDPKLYQYGGLWIYPVGGLVKLSSIFGYVELRSGPDALAWYIDHPEQFARFYVIARVYSAAFGLVGVAAVWFILKRITGNLLATSAGALAFAVLPVVVNAAHEAKPHLAGASLMLLAILAAMRFIDRPTWPRRAITAILCGTATGMVISSVWIVLIVPVAEIIAPSRLSRGRKLLVALATLALAAAIYFVTNPYVAWHLSGLGDRAILQSNLGNSGAMYSPSFSAESLRNAWQLLGDAASPAAGILGFAGAIYFLWKSPKRSLLLLSAVPAAVILVQFVALAAGKPGEYARFALFPSVVLMISVMSALTLSPKRHLVLDLIRISAIALVLGTLATSSAGYVWHFIVDSGPRPTRLIAAERLAKLSADGKRSLLVFAEPAPYCQPPVDLWKWTIVLCPKNLLVNTDVAIMTTDRPSREDPRMLWLRARLYDTPITWAGKSYRVFVPDFSTSPRVSSPIK